VEVLGWVINADTVLSTAIAAVIVLIAGFYLARRATSGTASDHARRPPSMMPQVTAVDDRFGTHRFKSLGTRHASCGSIPLPC
jgi:hypothetical protein